MGPGRTRADREVRLALWTIQGITARAIEQALSVGPLCDVPGARSTLADWLGLRGAARVRLLQAPALAAVAAAELDRLARRGGRAVLLHDPDYPQALGDLPDPPEVLEVRGTVPAGRAVAVVGSRRAPAAARELARALGAALARAGVAVVSGGALGIDAAAHRGALDAGGATLAVLGSGVLRPGPPVHRRLFADMLGAGGGLASELPCEEVARRSHFPRRNRLIAALADAVVVVAAAGCEGLIAAGVPQVASPDELLAALGIGTPGLEAAMGSPAERALLRVLGPVPRPLAALAADAGLDATAAAVALAGLSARRLVCPAGPGRFARR